MDLNRTQNRAKQTTVSIDQHKAEFTTENDGKKPLYVFEGAADLAKILS